MFHNCIVPSFQRFIAPTLTTLLLAGCVVPAPPVETTDPAAEATSAPEATDGACEEGFRFFDHELLATEPTCIPENPQRVAYLLYPSYIYPFGVNPVGSWGLERDAENYPLIAEWIMEGTVDHGMPPNLEVLIGLEPDLLLYDVSRVTDVLDELPQIAPLVTYNDGVPSTWQDRHRFNGEVFDQTALAEEQIATYEQRANELRIAIEESQGDVSDISVSVVRLRGEGVINLLGPWYTSVSVIQDIGFDLPDAVDLPLEEMQETHGNIYIADISQELIPTVDGNVLIVLGSPGGAQAQSGEGEQIVNEMMADPLWQTLNAVQTGAVYAKGDYWLQSNILTAHLVIDELADIFAVEIATPNPFLAD